MKSRPQKAEIYDPRWLNGTIECDNRNLLKDYVKLSIDFININDESNILNLYFVGKDRPFSFDVNYFADGECDVLFYEEFGDIFEDLYVKYRAGSSKIDKIAIDSKYLSNKWKDKRVLVLNETKK